MTGVGLRNIVQFHIPRGLLRDVQAALQTAGVERQECFVLMSGRRNGDTMVVRSVHVPEQIVGTHDRGLSVTVPGTELQRLNVLWAEHREELVAQMHSHPTMPYHSSTDDRYPMVTVEGGLSIVAPLFGFCSLTDLRSCAVFRLWDGQWQWVPNRDVDRLVRLI